MLERAAVMASAFGLSAAPHFLHITVQSVVRAPKEGGRRAPLKKNPLKNLGAMLKLNPYAKQARIAKAAEKKAPADRSKVSVGKKFYENMMVDSEYDGELFVKFASWLEQRTNAAPPEEEE